MDSLEQKIKEYISSVEIPDRVKPEEIKKLLEDNGDMTAGVFLRKLKELKISGSDFLELLGNSKIGNMEFRRIEENPHLKFDELLQILDNSVLSGDDYRMIIAVATQRKELAEQRKRREEETLRRMTEELNSQKNVHKGEEVGTKSDNINSSEKEPAVAKTVDVEVQSEDNQSDVEAENERTAAAEALILRMQNEIDSENLVENVNNTSDYTDSNITDGDSVENSVYSQQQEPVDTDITDSAVSNVTEEPGEDRQSEEKTEETSSDDTEDKSKSVTQEFCIPELPAEEQLSEEAEDFSGIIGDDEKIGSTAKDIGSAIGELMNDGDSDEVEYDVCDDEEDAVTAKRSKACLVTSFVCAAVLIAGGIALKALSAYGIIPNLTYDIPEKLEQNIYDYSSLLSEARAATGKISYSLPDEFVIGEKERSEIPKNVHGDTVVAAMNGSEVQGAKESEGKLSGNFSFDTGLTDAGIVKCGEYFAVIGGKDGSTVVRIYDESGIISGESVNEYILTGDFVGYYTDGSTLFLTAEFTAELDKAVEDKPETYVPSYTHAEETQTIPVGRMEIFPKINEISYYTCMAINLNGDRQTVLRSVLTGKNSACVFTEKGMYVTDTILNNNVYSTYLAYVMFDESLSTLSCGYEDIAVNPTLATALDNNLALAGVAMRNGSAENVLFVTKKSALYSIREIDEVAKGERIASMSYRGNVITLTTAGEKPMQYRIDATTLEEADGEEETNSIALNDKVSAKVTVTADKDGNRTGIKLSVGADKKAEAVITAESNTPGDWNKYLTSPVCDDISKLAFYETDGKIIIGIPVVYFDGISQVSRCKFYSYADGKLTQLGEITLFDEKYETLDCEIIGGDKPYILTMWDNRVITASIDKVKVISDTVFKTVEKKDSDKTESKTESGTDSKTESNSDSKTESNTDSKTESNTSSKSE